ncbi:MAG: signal peptidase I [Lactovum sp.]
MLKFIKEWLPLVLIIALIVLSRFYLWGSAVVKGPSMDPTLMNNQRLITLKIGEVKRGDIVVATESLEQTQLTDPSASKERVIVKRIIGMPGDTLTFNNDLVTIVDSSGETILLDETESYLESYLELFKSNELANHYLTDKTMDNLEEEERQSFADMASASKSFTTSSNPIDSTISAYSPEFTVVVPEGEYYLLGDNRVVSADSRSVGTFKESQIDGKVIFRFWPFNKIGTVK